MNSCTGTYLWPMAMRSSDPLAGVVSAAAAGVRLVFVPRRVLELGVGLGGSVMVPLWIAAPLLLPALAVAALTGYGLLWGIFWATEVPRPPAQPSDGR
ncbi:hypothetical protein P3T39_003415 [Kitasatospora sp. GP82]|nr:hypothetical protein [Kitasatospora sp. GP82]